MYVQLVAGLLFPQGTGGYNISCVPIHIVARFLYEKKFIHQLQGKVCLSKLGNSYIAHSLFNNSY